MLNGLFFFLIVGSVLTAAFTGRMPQVTTASLDAAKGAVRFALELVGQMALWLGFFGIVREGGMMRSIASGLRPLMRRLFPEVPHDHPAMAAMILNLAANMLGLGNAATPFGLKAMGELNKLNRYPGIATNPMALFISLNAAGVAILPLGAVAVRAAVGSKDPAGIVLPSFLSTFAAACTAVLVAKLLERRRRFAPERYEVTETAAPATPTKEPDAAALATAEKLAHQHPIATPKRRIFALASPPALRGRRGAGGDRQLAASQPAFAVVRSFMRRVAPALPDAGHRGLRHVAEGQGLRRLRRPCEGGVSNRHHHHSLPDRDPGRHRNVPRLGGNGCAGPGALPGHLADRVPGGGAAHGADQASSPDRRAGVMTETMKTYGSRLVRAVSGPVLNAGTDTTST